MEILLCSDYDIIVISNSSHAFMFSFRQILLGKVETPLSHSTRMALVSNNP